MNQLTTKDAHNYILSGRAIVTFQSLQPIKTTEAQFTYRIRRKKIGSSKAPVWYVYNNTDYIGYISNDMYYAPGPYLKASLVRAHAIRVFDWMWRHIIEDSVPTIYHILHHGLCGRCGRQLTDADSIRTGIGPECRKKIGLQLKLDYASECSS